MRVRMGSAQARAEGMPELQDPQMEVAAQMTAVGWAVELVRHGSRVIEFS